MHAILPNGPQRGQDQKKECNVADAREHLDASVASTYSASTKQKHQSDIGAMLTTSNVSSQNILDISTILILFDSEHLTAINMRKRMLIRQIHEEPQDKGDAIYQVFLTEMQWSTNILTSPLHRHSKSPLLWSHRRWLISGMLLGNTMKFNVNISDDRSDKLLDEQQQDISSPSNILNEMNVVFTAANAHPKNYYVSTQMVS